MSKFQASENKGKNQDWGEVERERCFGKLWMIEKTWRNPNVEALSEIYSYVGKVT